MKKEQEISLTKEEKNRLREKFLRSFCKSKGWNPDELTSSQMMQIVAKTEFKNPGKKNLI